MSTADRMTTTAGSLALAGFIPGKDAGIVRRLRNRGAVILGKANLSEWANFRSSYSSSGWSGRGGPDTQPLLPGPQSQWLEFRLRRGGRSQHVCCRCGQETDGSIVGPASANGIVGIKPTIGLISRAGIIPISNHQDTAGRFSRTVADAALPARRARRHGSRMIPRLEARPASHYAIMPRFSIGTAFEARALALSGIHSS